MYNTSYPLSMWSPKPGDSFNLEDSDDIMSVARQLIDGIHPGVFTTIDKNGRPHSRWMATLSCTEFPVMYTITAPHSRKVTDIGVNPEVSWMFSNHDLSLIANMQGKAEVIHDVRSIKHAWKAIEDKSHAYFLQNFAEKPGFVVIKTTIDHVELCIPESNLRWSANLEEFAAPHQAKVSDL